MLIKDFVVCLVPSKCYVFAVSIRENFPKGSSEERPEMRLER